MSAIFHPDTVPVMVEGSIRLQSRIEILDPEVSEVSRIGIVETEPHRIYGASPDAHDGKIAHTTTPLVVRAGNRPPSAMKLKHVKASSGGLYLRGFLALAL